MAQIPVETKISLLNKYIQVNILKNKADALHVDYPENEIFAEIIEDLKKMYEQPVDVRSALASIVDALNTYKQQQQEMRVHIHALLNTLKAMEEHQAGQIDLDTIIHNLQKLAANS